MPLPRIRANMTIATTIPNNMEAAAIAPTTPETLNLTVSLLLLLLLSLFDAVSCDNV